MTNGMYSVTIGGNVYDLTGAVELFKLVGSTCGISIPVLLYAFRKKFMNATVLKDLEQVKTDIAAVKGTGNGANAAAVKP